MYKIKNKQTKTKSFQYSTSAVFFTHISICYKLDNSISFLRGNITKLTSGPNLLKKSHHCRGRRGIVRIQQLGFSTLPPIKVQREGGKEKPQTAEESSAQSSHPVRTKTSAHVQNRMKAAWRQKGQRSRCVSHLTPPLEPRVFAYIFCLIRPTFMNWPLTSGTLSCSFRLSRCLFSCTLWLRFGLLQKSHTWSQSQIHDNWVVSKQPLLSAAPLLLYVLTIYSKQSTEWLLE